MEEEINYRALRKIQQLEKNTPVLTDLKTNFYMDLADYLKNLNNRLEKENDTQKKGLLKDEIENTKKIAFNIYEQREKKILLSAASKARGGNPDFKNMLSIEKQLFDSIINHMKKTRDNVFENKNCIEDNEPSEKDNQKEIIEENNNEKEETGNEKTSNTNPVLMVKKDVPEFVGTDEKKYKLRKNDVISISKDMANMLCKRDTVDKLEF